MNSDKPGHEEKQVTPKRRGYFVPGLPGAFAFRIDMGGAWKYEAQPDPICNPDDLYRGQGKYGY